MVCNPVIRHLRYVVMHSWGPNSHACLDLQYTYDAEFSGLEKYLGVIKPLLVTTEALGAESG